MEAAPSGPTRPDGVPRAAVILGNDTVLAAHPASASQLAWACSAAGFDVVVPPIWGDELVAQAYLHLLRERDERVVVACACPRVAALLDAAGPSPARASRAVVVPPPAAAARALRLAHGAALHVTYVGDCPAGNDAAIDVWLTPKAFFARLERQGVDPAAQPSDMPPSEAWPWARHASLPGGLPALRFLAREPVSRVMRVLEPSALNAAAAIAARSKVLVDCADAAHCACGANRDRVEDGEPPRASAPAAAVPVELDLAAPREGVEALTEPREGVESPAEPRNSAVAAVVPQRAAAAPAPPPPGAAAAPARAARVLAVLPVLVLAAVAALGAAVYAAGQEDGASGRGADAAAHGSRSGAAAPGGSSAARVSASPPGDPAAGSDRRSGVATSDTAPAGVAPGRSADSAGAASADSAPAARRRGRRTPRYRVVPGWLPQGRGRWTPPDTTRPPAPDTIPAPAAPPDTGGPPA